MTRGLAILLGLGAGCLVGMQAPVNSRLGKSVGSLQAATVSFLVGTAALLIVTSFYKGGLGGIGKIGDAPWWALVGGLFGAVFVSVAIFTVQTLGASGLSAVVIGGQLVMSVVIDRFGLLGLPRQAIGLDRIIGLMLLVTGVALVVRK